MNRWFIGGAATVILYTLISFFLVPYLTRYYLERFAFEGLKRQLSIEKVRSNPYLFRMEFSGLSFREGDGTPIPGRRSRSFSRSAIPFRFF